ncbi:suppressor protein SRP40 [Bradysia coprophila]|uniref:suppressor protein SRP40 n=1 Tax=Bradysia coprophila TaxID=38358 RepID=UPI00187DD69C|nr:suppressor protein SRP40 [Bradysia coprophila]
MCHLSYNNISISGTCELNFVKSKFFLRAMAKKYCKYTKEQLQEYCNDESYCVKCVDSAMHISLPPWGLKKFDESVRSIVSEEKLNRFDSKLNGIVLDIQSIKVVGEQYAVRNDSSALHVSLKVKFYVFQPRIGAVLIGVVKHVALHHISVTIHRFFNVVVPIEQKNSALKTNTSVMIKLTKFDLDDSIPYFEGKLEEILWQDQKEENSMDSGVGTTDSTNIRLKREQNTTNGQTESDSDSDTSEHSVPAVKREVKRNNSNGTVVKVKQEPVSSSESSSSDSENSSKALNSSPYLQVKLKNEKNSSSSSDDSSSDSNKSKHNKQSTVPAQQNGKRKHESGSSIIGRSLQKMSKIRTNDPDSSSSSDSEIDSKKKLTNISMNESTFPSPGLSSTRITSKTSGDSKSKSKVTGTNDFLKKMMSRFDK